MRLDPTTAAGVDSPMAAALALLDERDPGKPLLDLRRQPRPALELVRIARRAG